MTASGAGPGRSSRTGWAVALVLVVSLAVAAAIVVVVTRDDEPSDVFLVGDSLTVDAGASAPWPGGWLVDAAYGRTTQEGADILARLDLEPGIPVVVALGTNDRLDDAETYGRLIDEVVARIGDGHRILWVNVDANTPALAAAADGVNRALTEAAERHPQLEVADWSAHVADLEGFDAKRNPDGVHYTPEGSRVRHDWVVGLSS